MKTQKRTAVPKTIDTTPLFPPASDRQAWQTVLRIPRNRKMAREVIRLADRLLNEAVPAVPATLFMDFIRNGNRRRYEICYFNRRSNLGALVLAEVFEYQGKYLDKIVDYLWEVTSEHTWCLPAHCHMEKDPLPEPPADIVDLFAAETGMTLAQTLNLLENELAAISPNLVRIVRENMERRVIEPILRKPFPYFWLGGASNWTPWCCNNCLSTALCVLRDRPQKLRQTVAVVQEGIDNFIEKYPVDGGGIEGPTYWAKSPGMLLHYLEQLRTWNDNPKIKPMAEYIVDACLTPSFYAAFGDCPPRITLPPATGKERQTRICAWQVPPWICCRFGERVGSEMLIAQGVAAARNFPVQTLLRDLFGALACFCWVPARGPVLRKKNLSFYPATQLMFLKEAGVSLAFKRGGAVPHYHCDVGQVILIYRDQPLLIDLGSTEYRRETFSVHRFENWRINAEGHNVPQFNGIRQVDGPLVDPDTLTLSETADGVECRADLTAVYPKEAGVRSCVRRVIWNRKAKTLEICDSWILKKRSGNTVRIPFYTCSPVVLRGAEGRIAGVPFRMENCTASVKRIPLEDSAQNVYWGKSVNRIDVTTRSGADGECRLVFAFRSVPDGKQRL